MASAHVSIVLATIRRVGELHQAHDAAARQEVIVLHRDGQAVPAADMAKDQHRTARHGR